MSVPVLYGGKSLKWRRRRTKVAWRYQLSVYALTRVLQILGSRFYDPCSRAWMSRHDRRAIESIDRVTMPGLWEYFNPKL